MTGASWVQEEKDRRAEEAERAAQDKAFREGQSGPIDGKQYDPMTGTWMSVGRVG